MGLADTIQRLLHKQNDTDAAHTDAEAPAAQTDSAAPHGAEPGPVSPSSMNSAAAGLPPEAR